MLPANRLNQRNILAKLRSYLQQMERNERFVEDFQKGYCGGISSLWLYCKWLSTQPKVSDNPRDDYLWFDKTIRSIAAWDGKISSLVSEDSETILGADYVPPSVANFDRFIALIQLFQYPYMYLSAVQGDLHHILEDTYQTTQEGEQQFIPRHLKKEFSISSLLNLEQLKQLLQEDIIHKYRMVCVVAYNHLTAIFRDDSGYYYFDPNNRFGEVFTDSTDKLAEFMFRANNYVPDKSFPITLKMFSMNDVVAMQYPEVVDVLNRLSPDIINTDFKYTGLHQAARDGCIESVRYFLSKGIDPNTRDHTGGTVPMIAAHQGHVEVMQELLDISNIDLNVVDKNDRTALTLAAMKGHIKVVKLLLNALKDLTPGEVGTAILYASTYGKFDVVKELLHFKDIDFTLTGEEGSTALNAAIIYGWLAIVQELLRYDGINIDAVDVHRRTAFMIAAYYGEIDLMRIMLNLGADINLTDVKGKNVLMYAIEGENDEVIDFVVQLEKLDMSLVDNSGANVLMYVIKNHNQQVFETLLPHADVNLVNIEGNSALILAAQEGLVEFVRVLLKTPDINLEIINKEGKTAFMYAVESGNLKIVKEFLLSKKITPAHIDQVLAFSLSDNVKNMLLLAQGIMQGGLTKKSMDIFFRPLDPNMKMALDVFFGAARVDDIWKFAQSLEIDVNVKFIGALLAKSKAFPSEQQALSWLDVLSKKPPIEVLPREEVLSSPYFMPITEKLSKTAKVEDKIGVNEAPSKSLSSAK